MTRIKRGYIARRRRTKIRLFASSFQGAHSGLTRTITQQKIRALFSAYRDRGRQINRHLQQVHVRAKNKPPIYSIR
jgi:large subunit ribosomal protein L20